ncbi:MAG: hypothetical protein ABL986_20065 [Vicinamibacterales bacterium]
MVGDVDQGRLRFLARTLEQFRLTTTAVFPDRALQTELPLTVVVLSPGRKLDYDPTRSGNVGGYYTNVFGRDFIVVLSTTFSGSDFRTILHEYQHLIARANWPALPRWANEGIAEFYSTFEPSERGQQFDFGHPIGDHLTQLKTAGSVPLETFLTDDFKSIRMNEVRRVGVFYAQSWALVHFFQYGQEGRWTRTFSPFLAAVGSGQNVMEAFRQHVTPDVKAFERAFEGYIRGDRFKHERVVLDNANDGAGALMKAGKLPPAPTETLKATLVNDRTKSEKALDEALKIDPDFVPALTVRGVRSLGSRDTARAAETLTPLAKRATADAYTCSVAMYSLNLLGRFQESLELCETATFRDTRMTLQRAIALEGVGRATEAASYYAPLGRSEERELAPFEPQSWRYLENGRYRAAARIADLMSAAEVGSDDTIAYQRFVQMIALCLDGECSTAIDQLKRRTIPAGATQWVQQVYRFLTGQQSGDMLLSVASRVEEQTEARAYVGLVLLGQGQRAEAIPHLRWVSEKGSQRVTEYHVARAHLARLDQER